MGTLKSDFQIIDQSLLSPCAERMMDRGTCQICLRTSHQTSSTSPVRGKLDLNSDLLSIPKMRQHTAIKGGIQYSLNKTLESLCLAPVWFCLRWSGLHQQFCCHWNRSPASCMSTGNDLLRFHRPRQQYLQKKVNVRCVIDPTHNEVELLQQGSLRLVFTSSETKSVNVFWRLLIPAIQFAKVVQLIACPHWPA